MRFRIVETLLEESDTNNINQDVLTIFKNFYPNFNPKVSLKEDKLYFKFDDIEFYYDIFGMNLRIKADISFKNYAEVSDQSVKKLSTILPNTEKFEVALFQYFKERIDEI